MLTTQTIIAQTECWIKDVVIGLNFCPFAAKVVKQKAVHYVVSHTTEINEALTEFLQQCKHLDTHNEIATALLIFPTSFEDFAAYLNLVDKAENLIEKNSYEGVYQLASFHPQYCFAGSTETDAANYTNRSPYAMLHILREDDVEQALQNHADPEGIPQQNITLAQQKGLKQMQALRNACMK
jgi:uncharacterized protein